LDLVGNHANTQRRISRQEEITLASWSEIKRNLAQSRKVGNAPSRKEEITLASWSEIKRNLTQSRKIGNAQRRKEGRTRRSKEEFHAKPRRNKPHEGAKKDFTSRCKKGITPRRGEIVV
jgi:hypothetical protein